MARRSTIAILCAIELTLLLSGVAAADDVRERAAVAFDRGVSRFRLGDARAALAAFEEAYRLVPNPEILYNIGQTQLALHDDPAAYGALERYLAESAEVSRARRAEVERTLRRLRSQIAALVLTIRPRSATLSVDDGPAEPLPNGGVLYLTPGTHRIAVQADEHRSESRSVEVTAASEERLEVVLERRAAPSHVAPAPDVGAPPASEQSGPADAPTTSGGGVPLATFVFGTGAVAAVAIASVTGALALSRQSEVDEARAAWQRGEPVDRAAIQDRAQAGESLALITDVALAVGVLSAGAAIFFWVRAGAAEDEPAIRAAVAPLPGGLMVAVAGRTP